MSGGGGIQANGSLMLLLAYLLITDIGWRNARITLKLVVPDDSAAIAAKENIKNYIENLRINNIKSEVIIANGRPFNEILRQNSRNSDLVFLGMATPQENEDYVEYYETLHSKIVDLPSTIFVLAAPDFAFGEVLSDSQ